jgi:acyl-CoA synthetase (NDP forming)
MDEYLDFALEQPSTRVVGLFMETARNPDGLVRAFEKARQRKIPIVALKVGRTDLSARLTVSHSGAIAGEDAVYQALFDRYGVHRVYDMDQLATALIMFAQPHPVGAGGLVSLHDSGGERQLLIDLAHDAAVPLTQLSSETTAKLTSLLDPGLLPINPLDAWSTGGPEYHNGMQRCFVALMSDPGAAFGAVIHDRVSGGVIHPDYLDYLRAGHRASGKPAFLVANRQGTGADAGVVAATREGFPVLDGVASFLHGAKCLLEHRDHIARKRGAMPVLPSTALDTWREHLANGIALDENTGLQLLRDCGLPANAGHIAASESDARAAAQRLGFPVVLKTAVAGIDHKSDLDGVYLDIKNETQLRTAYQELSRRIGPRVLVAPMIEAQGVEMLLGMIHDDQFGPVVILGFGGVHVEALADVVYALPPFDVAEAHRLVDRLKLSALLRSPRHKRPLAIAEFCKVASQFSAVIAAMGDLLSEMDLNPVIVHTAGCVIVDALVVGRQPGVASHRRQAQ